jgi:hypothetical protein
MYEIENFPEWLTIVDIDERPVLKGGDQKVSSLSETEELSTEQLQREIKKLFNEIEAQSGGKKKSKKSSKSSKRSSKRKSSLKSAGGLDNYNIAANHIAEVMKLGKGPKERGPVHKIIKVIQKEIDQTLTGEAKYKEINRVFDANPKKYM